MAQVPGDYLERVYAGVLGKVIGVYAGKPFEGWPYRKMKAELGEIRGYVHERRNYPLIAPDDDISGTFAFVRALETYGPDVTPEQIGKLWLNEIIEGRTILWWGGLGVSTEHTAFLRLKAGIPAPRSGSTELNGPVVAEQIGAQIFIDGWGLVCPGDPARAADYARRAGSVSHDGEAIYGAQIVAAMVALAFEKQSVDELIDGALPFIPADCTIARLIADLRAWHAEGIDWEAAFLRIEETYGYAQFGGGCHMVPNHALIILALLWGGGDFSESIMIVNTAGWDTDCNSGNVGCILGVMLGLGAFDAPDWRGPVADRILIPTADASGLMTDCVEQAVRIANMGRALAGEPALVPKDGARYHFSLPGSVQGWMPIRALDRAIATLSNEGGALCVEAAGLAKGVTAGIRVATFPDAVSASQGYGVMGSPTLFSGQTVRLTLGEETSARGVAAEWVVHTVDGGGAPREVPFGAFEATAGTFGATVPDVGAEPILALELRLAADRCPLARVVIDRIAIEGIPTLTLRRGSARSTEQFVYGTPAGSDWLDPFRALSNAGTGLTIFGDRGWNGYRAELGAYPHLAARFGLAVAVQGLRRWVAALRVGDELQLVQCWDGEETVLARSSVDWPLYATRDLSVTLAAGTVSATLGETKLSAPVDPRLTSGAVAFLTTDGVGYVDSLTLSPI